MQGFLLAFPTSLTSTTDQFSENVKNGFVCFAGRGGNSAAVGTDVQGDHAQRAAVQLGQV